MANLLLLSFIDTETLCDFLCVLYLYWKVHFTNGEQEPLSTTQILQTNEFFVS
jgi:hypothetical protein